MVYLNNKTTSKHHRWGSATLSQLAFPGEGNPKFPLGEVYWDNTVVKRKTTHFTDFPDDLKVNDGCILVIG